MTDARSRGLNDHVEFLVNLLDFLHAKGEIGLPHDRLQKISELVVNSARDLTDRGQALRLHQLRLRLLETSLAIPGRDHLPGLLNDFRLGEGLVQIIPLIFEARTEKRVDVIDVAIVKRGNDGAMNVRIDFPDFLDRLQTVDGAFHFDVEECAGNPASGFEFGLNDGQPRPFHCARRESRRQ